MTCFATWTEPHHSSVHQLAGSSGSESEGSLHRQGRVTCRLVARHAVYDCKNNAFNQRGHRKILLTYGSLGQELLPGFLNVFLNAPLELSVGWEEDLIE